jgi:hypothetical protein
MTKKSILILFLIILLQSCSNKENGNSHRAASVSKKTNDVEADSKAQIEVVKNFMKWYIQNMNRLYKFRTIDGGSMNAKENEEAENYYVNFKEVEKYITELKKSGFLSDYFLQNKKQNFIDGEKYFKENPENDGPPFGFDYDPFFLTQDTFEEDLPNIERAKYKIRQIDNSNVEVEFYLSIPNINYKYSLKMINSKWLIDKIESV